MAVFSLGERKVAFHGDEWFIAHNATVIGTVILRNQASVWFNAVVRGDNDTITIGERTNIQDAAVLHVDPGIPLTLGRDVSVGHKAMLHGCTIGDGTLVGIGAIIMNHAVIGSGCLFAAGVVGFAHDRLVLLSCGRTGPGAGQRSVDIPRHSRARGRSL